MSKPVVLVTQTTVAKEAQQLLRDAGFEIVFMQEPIDDPKNFINASVFQGGG